MGGLLSSLFDLLVTGNSCVARRPYKGEWDGGGFGNVRDEWVGEGRFTN